MSIVPAMWLFVVTGRTAAEVDEALASEMVRAIGLNASDEFFAQHDAEHPLGVGFTGAQDILPQDWDEQTALSYIKKIPKGLVRDMLLAGTPDEVIDRAAEWRACGVRYVVLANVTSMQHSVRNGLLAGPAFSRSSGASRSFSWLGGGRRPAAIASCLRAGTGRPAVTHCCPYLWGAWRRRHRVCAQHLAV